MAKYPIGYLVIAAFVCVALASIIGGVALIGTPAEQRLIALDKKRVGDLRRLDNAVRSYHRRNGNLPESLAAISADWVAHIADPVTRETYTYRVTGERSYQICAVFARADDEPVPYRFKAHAKGFHCFDQKVEPKAR